MVFLGFTTIWSLAIFPIRRSPFSLSATTEGSTRLPRSVGTTLGIRFRTEATRVLVVPRSIPTMRALSAMGATLDFTGEPGLLQQSPGQFLDGAVAKVTMPRPVKRLLSCLPLLLGVACATPATRVATAPGVEDGMAAPPGGGDPATQVETRWRVVATARRLLGKTSVHWEGRYPDDCSGLVLGVYASVGLPLTG